MKKIPAIKSVMTAFPYWIESNDSLTSAKNMMEEHSISHLPVKEDGQLVGVVATHDIDQANANKNIQAHSIKDICVLNVYKVEMSEPLDNVVSHMASHHIGSALVMKDDRLVGVFTVNDACRCFVEFMRYQFRTGTGNDIA